MALSAGVGNYQNSLFGDAHADMLVIQHPPPELLNILRHLRPRVSQISGIEELATHLAAGRGVLAGLDRAGQTPLRLGGVEFIALDGLALVERADGMAAVLRHPDHALISEENHRVGLDWRYFDEFDGADLILAGLGAAAVLREPGVQRMPRVALVVGFENLVFLGLENDGAPVGAAPEYLLDDARDRSFAEIHVGTHP